MTKPLPPIELAADPPAPEALALTLADRPTDLLLARAPALVLAEAQQAARALKDVIDTKAKPVIFNGAQYLEFEDWQTLGRFYGITAKVVSSTFVEYADVRGFCARAVALRSDGAEISAAEAECLTDEPKWRSRPIYAWQAGQRVQVGEEAVPLFMLKSMAQTRACAKALRTVLAWVVVLAGYRPTPAEELPAEGEHEAAPAVPRKSVGAHTSSPRAAAAHPPASHVVEDSPDDGLVRVESVQRRTGSTHGRPWSLCIVNFTDARSASTFEAELAALAERCQESGAAVEVSVRAGKKPGQLELVGLRVVGEPAPPIDVDLAF